MTEAHQRLIKVMKLIEENYGRDKITPNLHLSLHLHECSIEYSLLYSFWCFSFECMNGVLGKSVIYYVIFFLIGFFCLLILYLDSLLNSHRQIELELMRRIVFDIQIADIESSGIVTKGLELLNICSDVGSLLKTDEFSSDEMRQFFLNSINI